MKRMRVLFGQRRVMVLVTLTILVLAAAALAASSASFTATSANPSNTFTAGALTISNEDLGGNSREGVSVLNLTAANMKPGDTPTTGTAVIGNSGGVSGLFRLSGSITAGDPAFSHYLRLTVTEDGTAIVSDQPLDTALATAVNLTGGVAWAGGAEHRYVFSVRFPDGADGEENAYMGDSATLRLQWDAVSD
jgi:hypothetical protein